MRGERVADLHGGFAVEVWIVGKHAAEHRDIRRSVGRLQDQFLQFLGSRQLLARGGLPGPLDRRGAFVRGDERELAGADLARLLGGSVQLAEDIGHLCGDLVAPFVALDDFREFITYKLTDSLRPVAHVAGQRLLHGVREPGSAFQCLA